MATHNLILGTCMTCVHFVHDKSECRRTSPTIFFDLTEDKYVTMWPMPSSHDFCSEYLDKYPEANEEEI